MTITTKYNIGDKVWIGTTLWVNKSVKCPECEYGYIKITLSTGAASRARCPVCYGRNFKSSYAFHPIVENMTIGSVRYDSDAKVDEQFSYMCHETGVGSGSIWYESHIFITKEEAEHHAQALTARARADGLKAQLAQAEYDKDEYNRTAQIVPED